MPFPEIVFRLPVWMEDALPDPDQEFQTVEDRMRLVIGLARQNIHNRTGGPFGAGIFDLESRRLVAAGVNLVEHASCSVLHAEIVAVMLAQSRMGHYDLGAAGFPPMEIVSSAEPCAMCMGAIPWSGVRQLVFGAHDEDARSIGFDEGPKDPDWMKSFGRRGIRVIEGVCRNEASAVLKEYLSLGGTIYNGRQGQWF